MTDLIRNAPFIKILRCKYMKSHRFFLTWNIRIFRLLRFVTLSMTGARKSDFGFDSFSRVRGCFIFHE